jgi:hypothetical protein
MVPFSWFVILVLQSSHLEPMRSKFLILLLTATLTSPASLAQNCRKIRGRAILYRGDAFFEIWHVGTRHTFYLTDEASIHLVCRYFDCKSVDRQPALFADFTVCPTERYRRGASQPTIVRKVEHARVIPEWKGHDE